MSKPVSLGIVVYIKGEERDTFRPSIGTSVAALLFGGGFALITSYMTLIIILWALNVMFGWEFPGILTNAGSSGQTNPPRLFGVVMLGMSLLPGIFAAAFISGLVQLIGFWWRQPTFDYTARVFRRGQRTVCHLRDISEIHIRRITDPNYPGKAKFGLALSLCDGSWQPLEWQFHLRSINRTKFPYTDFGEFNTVLQQEAVRAAAAEMAERVGVPLKVSEERGNFTPSQGI